MIDEDLLEPSALDDRERISLCEALDRVLNKGVVIAGEAVISVADVDLIYLGLQVVLTSVETAREMGAPIALRASATAGADATLAAGSEV